MLSSLLLIAWIAPPTVWTVDDDGPADFSDLAAAVAFAQAGDVISIAPGSYGSISVDKRLSLIGQSGAELPSIPYIEVDGAARIDLRRLDLSRMSIANVAGFSRVDECIIEYSGSSSYYALDVEDASQLLVRGCSITATGDSYGDGRHAMRVGGTSRVHVVDCNLRGADAEYSPSWEYAWAGWGGTGLIASDQSRVTLVASQVQGGGGQSYPGGVFPFSAPDQGMGGNAVTVQDDAFVDARGASVHALTGGLQEFEDPSAGVNGMAIEIHWQGTGTAEHGGVTLVGASDGQAVWPRPFLTLMNEGFPGGIARVLVYGQPGQAGMLVSSLQPSLLSLPVFGPTALWIDAGNSFDVHSLSLVGLNTPAMVSYSIPNNPNLVGAALLLQACELGSAGTYELTNAGAILVGE